MNNLMGRIFIQLMKQASKKLKLPRINFTIINLQLKILKKQIKSYLKMKMSKIANMKIKMKSRCKLRKLKQTTD